MNRTEFSTRALILISLAGLVALALYLLARLSAVLLLLFAAVLLAVLLDGLVRPVTTSVKIPRLVALLLVLLLLVSVPALLGWLVGPELADQLGQLSEHVQSAVASAESWLSDRSWGEWILDRTMLPEKPLVAGAGVLGRVAGAFSTAAGWLFHLVIAVFVGIFLAVSPGVYSENAVKLVPCQHRDRTAEVLEQVGRSLQWWLVGRFASMAVVGVLTAVGLKLIGMPLALILGLIAGLLSFVPMIGPTVALAPGVLVAAVEGWTMVLYAGIVYVGVQQIEGFLVTPLIQQRTVAMPPAVLLAGQLCLGVLFGSMGVVFATPLLLVVIVVVQLLYVEDLLGEEIHVLGAH